MAKLTFDAPNKAPAHLALRKAAVAGGFDENALRRLLWLTNAHPRLTAHARVFKHIGDHLSSRTFQTEALAWAREWVEDVPEWRKLCHWIWTERLKLQTIPGLNALNQQPSHEGDHPHVNEGAVRHGVPAALWTIHESVQEYPPSTRTSNPAAERYFELQGHVLAVYAECRFRLSSLEFFESYSERIERPIAPMRTDTVSPVVRNFATPMYAPLLPQFPAFASTREYSEAIESQHFSLKEIPEGDRHRARQYLDAIRRYFHRYLRVLQGWRPEQSTRPGWDGGSRARRPGFVDFAGAPGVYMEAPGTAPGDSGIAHRSGQRIFVDRDTDNEDDPSAAEGSGLAPAETLEEAFELFTPEELKGRLIAVRYQRLALQMRAQALPFDYANLTPQELRDVWVLAEKRISRFLRYESSDDAIRNAAAAGLILQFSLCFGQKVETVRELSLTWLLEGDTQGLPSLDDARAALILRAPKKGDWNNAQLVGLRLRSIIPTYKTVLPNELGDVDREYAKTFVLPDHFGLGNHLISFLRIQPTAEGRVFGIRAGTLRHAIKNLLEDLRNDHITSDRIALALPTIATTLTGDQSLTWMLTANASFSEEPRVHYTRHQVPKLLAVYQRASRRLSKSLGIQISSETGPAFGIAHQAGSVGARFVLARDELRGFLSSMIDELSDRNVDRANNAEIVRYHNLYVLFTVIYQSLSTSMRAITSPGALYLAWSRQNDGRPPLRTALSDKDTEHDDKARLALISSNLAKQFAHFRTHEEYVGSQSAIWLQCQTTGRRYRPFFALSDDLTIEPFTPSWIARALLDFTGYPIPANFHRAFLRTELLERGCPAEIVDAFLGHFIQGESPFGTFSTFDFQHYASQIEHFLKEIHDDLGLRPVASRLVPFATRMAAK
jgi:hypothetical protein